MRRRDSLGTAGAGVAVLTAGCFQVEEDESESTTEKGTTVSDATTSESSDPLTVATHDSFFGDEGTAGRWLKDNREGDYDTEIDALEPPEPVTFTYDEPAGDVDEWTASWTQSVASD